MHEHSLCMEAVVSEPISVLPNGMINPELFTFVCTYIDQLTSAEPAFLTQSDIVFNIHPMKQYRKLLSLEVGKVERLKKELEGEQQKPQRTSQELEAVSKELEFTKQQLEEMKKAIMKVWQMKMLELFYVNLFCLACFHTGKRRKPQGIVLLSAISCWFSTVYSIFCKLVSTFYINSFLPFETKKRVRLKHHIVWLNWFVYLVYGLPLPTV